MTNILLNVYAIDEWWCYEILKDIIRPEFRVTVIPFSFSDEEIRTAKEWKYYYGKEGKYYQSIVRPLGEYGIANEQIQFVNYFLDTPERAVEQILDSEIVYFTGGLPDRMMERLQEFGLTEVLEHFPGIVIGCSAGALIQLSEYHISPDEDYEEYTYQKGLSMLEGFDIEVHYNASYQQKMCMRRAVIERKKPVYAIENEGGLLVQDGEITAMGRVYRYERELV